MSPGGRKGLSQGWKLRKNGLSATKRKYAKARAEGATMRAAAAQAGMTSRRALQGVTGTRWEKEPEVIAAIKDYAEKQMSGAELNGRLAAMVRGEIPTGATRQASGAVEARFDQIRAADVLSKNLGLQRQEIDTIHSGGIEITWKSSE